MYINDLPNFSDRVQTTLFADDTTITLTDSNFNRLTDTANVELRELRDWTYANKLSLNVDKTSSIIFSNRRYFHSESSSLFLCNDKIKYASSCKFLGVIIDSNLSFNDHIRHISSKISKSVGIFRILQRYLPKNVLLNIYYSLIYPYLTYANIIWGGTHECHLNSLIILQKKLIRIISNAEYLAHTDPLFFDNQVLKVIDIHKYLLAQDMYKRNSSNNLLTIQHTYNTRFRHDAQPTNHRLDASRRLPSYAGATVWNSLPDAFKSSQLKFHKFKKSVKSFYVNQYS